MWSRNLRIGTGLAALTLAGGVFAPAAGAAEIEVTQERAKICARAEKRFKKAYPDYQVPPGVQLVMTYKYNFCPANLTVKKGTTVRWLNIDKRTSHSVWMKAAGVPESDRLFPEEMFEFTFAQSGPYPYLCGPHWEQENMLGFVKVVD